MLVVDQSLYFDSKFGKYDGTLNRELSIVYRNVSFFNDETFNDSNDDFDISSKVSPHLEEISALILEQMTHCTYINDKDTFGNCTYWKIWKSLTEREGNIVAKELQCQVNSVERCE